MQLSSKKTRIFYTIIYCITALTPYVTHASFSDVSVTHPNKAAIDYLEQEGIIEGYNDGSYRPNQILNRAEFIKILMYAKFGQSMVEQCGTRGRYTDVPHDAWFASSICRATDDGIIEGYADRTMRPEQAINMAEAAKIVSNTFASAFGYPGLVPESDGGPWYKRYIQFLDQYHAIPVSITKFDQSVTRGEMAEMVYRILARKHNLSHTSYESIEGLPTRKTTPNAVEFDFTVHSTLPPHTFYLLLDSGKAAIMVNSKQILSFDLYHQSDLVEIQADNLRNGTVDLRSLVGIQDVNGDDFIDVVVYGNDKDDIYAQYIYDPQAIGFQVKYGSYPIPYPTRPAVDDPVNVEYCAGPIDNISRIPMHPDYEVFGELGVLFTASDCGTQRYTDVLSVFPKHVAYAEIILKTAPPSDFYNSLYAVGLACSDSGTVIQTTKCIRWTKSHLSEATVFLDIKEWGSWIQSTTIRLE